MEKVEASRAARSIARAEPAGSLMRSPTIMAQVEKVFASLNSAAKRLALSGHAEEIAELNRLVDRALADLVRRQIDAGLDVVTDGEQRRAIFVSPLYDSVDGLQDADSRQTLADEGGKFEYEALNEPRIGERVHKVANAALEEATVMRALTDYPFKVTLPAPSYFFTDFIDLIEGSYVDHSALLEDVVTVTKQLALELVAGGVRWIQYDFPIYPALVADDSSMLGPLIDVARGEGETVDSLLEKSLAADSAVAEGLPDDVTVALHLCRGNIPGGMWNGSLAPIAEQMFSTLPHDRFLFEWEDIGREGDFSPIRHVPKGRVMAMGLVSTKDPEVESEDEILHKIESASECLDVEQLGISPQCGFASVFHDRNADAEDIQWRKLEVIGRVADRVWGV